MDRMTNIKGLDPIRREWPDELPLDERQVLEEIRRAGNAVRSLRRRGQPDSAARRRFAEACQTLEDLHEEKRQRWLQPTLFEGCAADPHLPT